MPELSIVIPVYNEEQNIPLLYSRIRPVAESVSPDYEIIFVNDGSHDNTIGLVRDLASREHNVKYIDFSRNFGHQMAVMAGLDHSTGKYVAIIDADLQDPPELIADMYKKAQTGFEVVYAKRKSRAGESAMKKMTARLFYRALARLTSVEIPVDTGDFRIVHRKIVDVLKDMPEQQKFLRGQISWAGFRQTYIEYDREERNAGQTGYTYKKMMRFALDGITSFSNWPLKFATIAGFIVSAFSFVMILYALYSRFVTKEYVAGWTSIMLAVLFIGGVQLICLGIIGEYISRISANVRNRPLYIVRESNINGNV